MDSILDYLKQFFTDFFIIINEMSPYLLLGLLFAGFLKVFLPERFITKYLKKPNLKSVVNATLLGIPMPLCSCGVLPTGISLYKNGASKGATNAFLTSTPQTGVDSILVTYAMLGLPMAIIRPIVALISGILSGVTTNKLTKTDERNDSETQKQKITCAEVPKSFILKLWEACKYAFYTFLSDIARWLIIGTIIAAIISVLLPHDFFADHISQGAVGILLILVGSMPLYICATASVPIAAILLSKGISPGAILVFLMAGPATNAASFTLIGKTLGKRTLISYLGTIIIASVGFGLLMDAFLPREWFQVLDLSHSHHHESMGFLFWFQTLCTVILISLILNIYIKKYKQKLTPMLLDKNTVAYLVPDISCNHCKATLEKSFNALEEVDEITVNLAQKTIQVKGNISDESVEKLVTELGFTYNGRLK